MPTSISSPADAVNAALRHLGRSERVGHLYDGSAASKAFLDLYGQTRDELLRVSDWGFARRDADLALLKSAPPGGYNPIVPWTPLVNPPLPYAYEYAYPDDCLMVRSIRLPTMFWPVFTPKPAVFEIANDQVGIPLLTDAGVPILTDSGEPIYAGYQQARVILCYIPNAIATYCGQVTDPTTWDVGFTQALIEAIGERVAPLLAALDQGKLEDEKIALAVAPAAAAQAVRRVG